MLLLCSTLISFFYILFIAENLWNKVKFFTPSWGDSQSLIYILLISYLLLNIIMFTRLVSRFKNIYIYVFTVLSIGYIYTLYNTKMNESFLFVLLLLIYQVLIIYTEYDLRYLSTFSCALIVYLTLWTNKLKENYY